MQRITPVILNLIIINVLVYFAQQLISPFNVTEWGALHFYQSPVFKPHQLVTHMFMHDTNGIGHLLFNMLTLWIFGTMLENYLGSKRFLIFYLICGFGAGLLTQLSIPYSAGMFAKSAAGVQLAAEHGLAVADIITQYEAEYQMIGASGAIMGVMAAFAYLFPNTELYIMLIPVPVKAKYVIPVYVLIDLFGGFYQFAGDNIGHFTHLGGALVGFLLIYYWNKTNRKTFY